MKKKYEANSHVIYMYTVYGIHAYLGRGITFKRAHDLKGHKHCIPSEMPHNIIDVHIVAKNLTLGQAKLIENEMIRDVGLKGVWNNINGMTPDKARKLATEILNRPIAKKGFMTVPKSLSNRIIKNIKIKNGDSILIPSDKNANFHTEIRKVKSLGQTDIVDLDIGSRSLHAEVGGTTLIIDGDFLTHKFNKKYKLIVMNPPWTNLGIEFIAKAESLLEDGGKMVCIISYNQLSSKPGKNGPVPGTFLDLHSKGNYLRIETYSGGGWYGSRRGEFTEKGDWVWFIWEKTNTLATKTTPTKIVNRYSEEFDYIFDGNEYLIPQIPNEREIFDYKNGVNWSTLNVNKSRKKDALRFKWTKKDGFTILSLSGGEVNTLGVVNILPSWVNPEKLQKVLEFVNPEKMKAMYANSLNGATYKFPPIRKELLI